MSNRFGPTVLGLIAFGSMAQAQVAQVWVPGTKSPTDIHGNRAVANAPKPGESDTSEPASPAITESWAPFGPSGADTQSIAASPTANVVIAGVGSSLGGGGIYVTSCNGCYWTQASGTGNRTVKEVEFASTGRGWAATDNGLFTSTDNGQTWTEVFLPIGGQALVEDVFVDPADPNTIWVGLGQFFGGTSTQLIFKSTDNGANWTDLSPPMGFGMGTTVIAVDPANTQRIYAAFSGNFGFGNELWISTNGGASWEERSSGVPNNIINDIAFSNGTAYIAGGQDFGNQFLGVYSTSDDGLNWNNLSFDWPSQSAMSVAIDPVNPQKILAGTTRGGLVVSTNGGTSWSYSVGNTGTYQVNDIEFVPTNNSEIYLGLGSVAVLRSTNGGTSFNPAAGGISRLEITSFAVNPLNTDEIAASYVGQNDGGIFVSTDAGATWTLSSAPLPRWQKVYFSPQGTLYASHDGPLGRANDGLWVRGANDTWTNLGPGSPSSLDNIGMDIAVSSGPNPVILWTGYRWLPQPQVAVVWSYGRIAPNTWELEYSSTQFGEYANSVTFMNNGAGPGAVVGQISFGQDGVGAALYSTDNGDTWNLPQSWAMPNWHVWDVTRGPGDTVYALASANTGNNPSGVFKSTDGGVNWTMQGSYPGGRTMVADPVVAGTLYTYPTFTNPVPHRSTDDGVSFQPFSSGFLNNVAGRDIVYGGMVGDRRRLYIASSAGGFATDLSAAQPPCSADFDGDGDYGTDADIQAFFACLAGDCCPTCGTSDYNGDGDYGTDADIEAFFRVLGGNPCNL